MASWGQAMSLYHQLWRRPPEADLKRGGDLLEHARQLKPKTEREREYISALAVFYRDSDKLDHPQRADAYAAAMESLHKHNPKDREAAVFYALSLLGSKSDDPTLANPRKAVAILNQLFEQDPGHLRTTLFMLATIQ